MSKISVKGDSRTDGRLIRLLEKKIDELNSEIRLLKNRIAKLEQS
tara:strand:+ start:414 stop:548 length:135 start_codon:yes stop_codon:yes gene_type:complete